MPVCHWTTIGSFSVYMEYLDAWIQNFKISCVIELQITSLLLPVSQFSSWQSIYQLSDQNCQSNHPHLSHNRWNPVLRCIYPSNNYHYFNSACVLRCKNCKWRIQQDGLESWPPICLKFKNTKIPIIYIANFDTLYTCFSSISIKHMNVGRSKFKNYLHTRSTQHQEYRNRNPNPSPWCSTMYNTK